MTSYGISSQSLVSQTTLSAGFLVTSQIGGNVLNIMVLLPAMYLSIMAYHKAQF